MRIPDPIANTTTEAYLAYKAGVLSEGDLKPKLYDPYIHLDAWLAYWAGLTTTYPVKNVGKNLFRGGNPDYTGQSAWASYGNSDYAIVDGGYSLPDRYTAIAFEYDNLVAGEEYVFSADYVGNANFFFSVGVNMQAGGSSLPHSYKDYGAKTTSQRLSFKFTASATNRIGFNSGYASGNTLTLTNIQLERSSTATAYEPYAGEPEMLTDEEALVAYLSGVTNTYPEEFRDPADVRVAAYLKYLVSARFGRPEYPVNNEEFYLSLMKPPVVTNDTPSSDIELDNTCEAPFIDVKAYGDTSQTTYTGKNMLTFGNSNLSGSRFGITYSYDAATQEWSLNGTAEYQTDISYPSGAGIDMHLASGVRYTTTGFYQSGSISNGSVKLFQQDSVHGWQGISVTLSSAANNSEGFTPNTDIVLNESHIIRVAAGTVLENFKVKFQTEQGSTATSFEPYVGGIPAPNPDYPQAVNTVTGRQVVKVEGKNLYNATKAETTLDGITYSGDNEALYLDGSIGHNQGIAWGNVPLSAGTYTLTLELVSGSFTSTSTGALFYVYGDNISISPQNPYLAPSSPKLSIAVTVSADTANAHITSWTRSTEHFYNAVIKYQLVKGETADYDFEPHKVEDYEINLGKNLINIPYRETEWLGARVIENGSTVTMRPDSNGNMGMSYYSFAAPVAIPAGETITWSRTWLGGGTWTSGAFTFPLELTYSDGTTESITMGDTTKSNYLNVLSKTKTLEKDVVSVKIVNALCYSVKGLSEETAFGLQLELGSTATSYAPYFEPIELCKIGDYQDYIYEDEGEWYLHKAIVKYTFNGSEDWASRQGENVGLYQLRIEEQILLPANASAMTQALSSHFVPQTNNYVWFSNGHPSFSAVDGSNPCVLRFSKGEATNDLAEWKTWLESNNVSAYAVLATATDTEITNTALIDQLNALKKGGSYTGTTYIKVTATDPNLPALLKVEAGEYR